MPSSVLHAQIPHALLFPDQPLYFLPPRVFGYTCFVHILTPGQDKLSAKATKCIFLGYSQLQKGCCCYSPQTHRYFLFADVTFFEDSPFFSSSESLPVTEVLPLPIISSPIFDDVSSRPLQVYHRRHHAVVPLLSAEAPADSLPLPSASPTPTLPLADNLPIGLRKGNRSTSNPHPIYNFLSYHRLSSPYSAFVSTISSVSLPKNTNEALSHLGWRQAMVDKWLLCTPLALGILLFYHLVSFQLVVVGSTQLRLVLMVRLTALRPAWLLKDFFFLSIWLLKDILRFMVLIMVTPSPLLPRLLLSVCFSPWLLCLPGRFFSWILKMSSFMVILSRKFIWNNPLVLLLRGSLV